MQIGRCADQQEDDKEEGLKVEERGLEKRQAQQVSRCLRVSRPPRGEGGWERPGTHHSCW